MSRKVCRIGVAALCLAVAGWVSAAAAAGAPTPPQVAHLAIGAAGVEWVPAIAGYDRLTLRVSGPDGVLISQEFKPGANPALSLYDAHGQPLRDGGYTWELTAVPRIDPALARQLAAAREAGDDAAAAALQRQAGLASPLVQSGHFAISGGALVAADIPEPRTPRGATPAHRSAGGGSPTQSNKDQVIADDLIVQGSACIGLDCVNNESFGFDTIRLKENNTRIKFDDTSTGTGFPNHDWQLTANDSASGGANKFSIEDITAATVPFTVTGSAPTNSVFVDSTGRVGLRTSTPVLDLHIATGNTPAMRLEQNSSGGFTAQTWDIAGNEANFFVRDVTGGSRLPFRIRPGAPTSSIDINATGNVGMGTASPSANLHVSTSTGSLATVMKLTNNSGVQFLLERTDAGANSWQVSNFNTSFAISIPGSAQNQMVLSSAGNMTISGTTYNTGSSREIKENFTPVSPREILDRVVEMPLTEWNLKTVPNERHIGPIAEDWWALFGLGMDDKHVSLNDVGGVALAAIKGLHQEVVEKDSTINELRQTVDRLQRENDAMAARVAAIEQALKQHSP
ncbi:MAG TPA: tail fiber domain-containing protein [Solirubrobacterales bacterium]|nr:tail fiber domain-containing protein [Solirubrobacterales bacterium]